MTEARGLRDLSAEELREKEGVLRRELFSLRIQTAGGQQPNPARFRQVRREIARLLTVLQEKRS